MAIAADDAIQAEDQIKDQIDDKGFIGSVTTKVSIAKRQPK